MTTTFGRGAPASGKTDSGGRGSHAVRWWVLVVLGVAQLMVTLDATVMNIALPEAQHDLGFTHSHKPGALTVAQAGVESCTATLTWGAGIFVVGAVLTAFLTPNKALAPPEGEPVIAH
ncbi:hypothetical protein AB0E85_37280 [Streptomyces sp. NPDC029044]|uniref:hypothetical protein n=1 Tax=Streptomyces sp. NPDC029044 TaxID=3157198 RepID=UPI0033F301A6